MALTAKKIVLTGASSGIGLQLLKLLLAEGATVMAAVKPGDRMELVHGCLTVQPCDVSRTEDMDLLFERALSVMGTIDIFIANAGFAYYERLDQPNWEHIQHIFETNTFSVMYAAQKMKLLHGDRPYQFVTTSSAMSILPLPGYALYSATKAAVRGFAEAYRYELEAGQHFQTVYPVATSTAFFRQAGDSPVPWPTQKAETVAAAILRGIKRKRNSIYPSRLFVLTMVLNRLLPFVFPIYSRAENYRFQHWLEQKRRNSP